MKNFFKWFLFLTVAMSGGVFGAAAQDRLSAIFNVGQGSAGSKAMVFDSGNTSSNAQVSSTANTNLNLATGGSTRLSVSSSGSSVTGDSSTSGVFLGSGGANSAPTFSFTGDTDTGIYRRSANQLSITTGGVDRLVADSTGSSFDGQIFGDGSKTASGPAFTFGNDDDTGMYRNGANSIGISAGGSAEFIVESAGVSLGHGVQTESNGYIKWKVYSGTLSASACTDLTVPSSTVLGAVGFATVSHVSTQWRVMDTSYGVNCGGPAGTPVNNSVCFNTGSATNIVAICNYYSSNANDYRVVAYYQ